MMKKIFFIFSIGFFNVSLVAADNNLIPLEYFAKLSNFKNPIISPDGQRLAVILPVAGRSVLTVQTIYNGANKNAEKPYFLGSGEYYFSDYEWVNDKGLVVGVRATDRFQGALLNLTRLAYFGPELVKPFRVKANDSGYFLQHAKMISRLKHDDSHIYAMINDRRDGFSKPELSKVNIYSGESQAVEKNRLGVQRWIVDSNDRIRIGVKTDTKRSKRNVTVFYRETEGDDWEVLQKVDYFDHHRLVPVRFDDNDPNILLISSDGLSSSRKQYESEMALFRYDLTKREVVGPYEDKNQTKAKSVIQERWPELKVKFVSKDDKRRSYVFKTYSDVKPPVYYLYLSQSQSIHPLSSEYPELDNATLSPTAVTSYSARDKLEIPAFVTMPVNVGNSKPPLIVFVHGGPWSHDEWGFDPYVQFFASRGYAVFQPQFRGSTGYGIGHEEAGYKQWGAVIQDDITDGVKWLIEQGEIDPQRICIVGASFGGYAAAMGAAKTPDLYKCAVSINGVLDLKKHLASANRLLYKTIHRAMWNDWSTAENFSPYHLSNNIKVPMLLIASKRDTVVPYTHSKNLYKKLKKHNNKTQYVELKEGEHWRTNEASEIRIFKELEQFLAKHL